MEPGLLATLLGRLTPEHFVDPCHRAAWEGIVRLYGQGIDFASPALGLELKKSDAFQSNDIPVPGYLAELNRDVPTSAHCEMYVKQIVNAHDTRRIIEITTAATNSALDGTPAVEVFHNLAEGVESIRGEMTERLDHRTPRPIRKYTAEQLIEEFPQAAEPIVDGLFRRGETVNFVSDSKAGKSCLGYQVAISIIQGIPLFDKYETTQGRVLLIDNELKEEQLASRLREAAFQMGITFDDFRDRYEIWSLRGGLRDLDSLMPELMAIKPGEFDLIMYDARYRFCAEDQDENSNAFQTHFYNTIDAVGMRTQAAQGLVLHSTKGDQSQKKITDVGSGGGAQSRAADVHLVLREHEEEGVFVFEGRCRSFPSPEPTSIRFSYPIWEPAEDLDPTQLKGTKNNQTARTDREDPKSMDEVEKILRKEQPLRSSQIRDRAGGWNKDKTNRILKKMRDAERLISEPITYRGNKTHHHYLPAKKTEVVCPE